MSNNVTTIKYTFLALLAILVGMLAAREVVYTSSQNMSNTVVEATH